MVCVCISDYERYCTVFLLNSYMWKVELSCYSRQLASSIGSFVLQDSPFSFPFCKCVLSNFLFLIVWHSIIASWFCLLMIQLRGWSELMHVILFYFRNNLTFIIASFLLHVTASINLPSLILSFFFIKFSCLALLLF